MFSASDLPAFIDHGGSLFSRARGGYKGFSEHFGIEELEEVLSNPQFPGKPANEAYASLVEVKRGAILGKTKIIVKDRERLRVLLRRFEDHAGGLLMNKIIDQSFLDGRRSVQGIQVRLEQLERELPTMKAGSADHKKAREAIETFKRIIEAGGEATYLKRALSQRRDDIINLLAPLVR
ncbi:MAG: hypothetical protein Q8P97_02055 [bacterium]|nr:hypothetical protein [bacterium]